MPQVPELRLEQSFNARTWAIGTARERVYQADILIEQVGEFGLAGIDDEGWIVNPHQRADTFRAIDLLFHTIPREVKRAQCVSTADPNLGYF